MADYERIVPCGLQLEPVGAFPRSLFSSFQETPSLHGSKAHVLSALASSKNIQRGPLDQSRTLREERTQFLLN